MILRKVFTGMSLLFLLLFFENNAVCQGINNSSGYVVIPATSYVYTQGYTAGASSSTSVSGNMFVSGDWTNNSGTITFTSGTVTFNGSSAQEITGSDLTTFYNMTIAASAEVHIPETKTVNVDGTMTNSAGNSGLVIQSSASGTGNFIHNTQNIAGTVKRYITGNSSNKPYHVVSSPIDGAAFGSIWTSGDYNVYWYNEANSSGNVDDGWTRISAGTLSNGKGYNIVSNYANRTISFTGNLLVPADISSTITVSYTSSGTAASDGWNLIGNPYACGLNVPEFLSDNSANLETANQAVYYWDNPSGDLDRGDYATRASGSGAVGGSAITPDASMAVAQGFFIKVKSGVSSVSLAADQRIGYTGTQFFTPDPDEQLLRLSLIGPDNLYNELLFGFYPFTTDELDPGYDVQKLRGNPLIAVYSLMPGYEEGFVIQSFSSITEEAKKLNIGYFGGQEGNYSFNIKEIENIDPSTEIFIEDREEKLFINLITNPNYSFYSRKGEFNERFAIHINPVFNSIQKESISNFRVFTVGNKILLDNPKLQQGKIVIHDILGKELFRSNLERIGSEIVETNLASAYYLVSILTDQETFTQKIYIQ